ncbi:hypothetical protein HYT02_03220 [Candidatus Gottesmanbacteria bacterium]|nr:hypothetical protein [Candidatus Gottesmanbacteria bacterium]
MSVEGEQPLLPEGNATNNSVLNNHLDAHTIPSIPAVEFEAFQDVVDNIPMHPYHNELILFSLWEERRKSKGCRTDLQLQPIKPKQTKK